MFGVLFVTKNQKSKEMQKVSDSLASFGDLQSFTTIVLIIILLNSRYREIKERILDCILVFIFWVRVIARIPTCKSVGVTKIPYVWDCGCGVIKWVIKL